MSLYKKIIALSKGEKMNKSTMQIIRMQTEKIWHYIFYVLSMNRIINELLINGKGKLIEVDIANISEVNMIYTKRLYECIAKLYHAVEKL